MLLSSFFSNWREPSSPSHLEALFFDLSRNVFLYCGWIAAQKVFNKKEWLADKTGGHLSHSSSQVSLLPRLPPQPSGLVSYSSLLLLLVFGPLFNL